jgi:hypothetical protein
MAEIYTPGEVHLIRELVSEFPSKLKIVVDEINPGKIKLQISDSQMLGFVEYLITRLRLSRKYLEDTTSKKEETKYLDYSEPEGT